MQMNCLVRDEEQGSFSSSQENQREGWVHRSLGLTGRCSQMPRLKWTGLAFGKLPAGPGVRFQSSRVYPTVLRSLALEKAHRQIDTKK